MEEEILRILKGASQGVPTEKVCATLAKTPQELGDAFAALRDSGKALGFAGVWIVPDALPPLESAFLEALHALHEAEPGRAYQPLEKVAQRAGLRWEGKPLARLAAHLGAAGLVTADGTRVKAKGFLLRLSPRQKQLLARVLELLKEADPGSLASKDIANALGVPVQAVDEILKLGQEAGDLFVSGDVMFTQEQVDNYVAILREKHTQGPIAASQVREWMGLSRRLVTPLLELLDRLGVTAPDAEEGRRLLPLA